MVWNKHLIILSKKKKIKIYCEINIFKYIHLNYREALQMVLSPNTPTDEDLED